MHRDGTVETTTSRAVRRFEQFRTASGLADEGDARQVSTLLYCMGQEADDVLTTIYRDNDRGQEEVRPGTRKAQRILQSEEEHRF